MIRWIEREEMLFDSDGEAVGYALVKVLQQQILDSCDGVHRLLWVDVPTVRE